MPLAGVSSRAAHWKLHSSWGHVPPYTPEWTTVGSARVKFPGNLRLLGVTPVHSWDVVARLVATYASAVRPGSALAHELPPA
jgi:hypothetical protein